MSVFDPLLLQDALNALRVAELKDLCSRLGLRRSAPRKADYISRINRYQMHPGPGANATDIRGIINRLFEDCGRDPLPEALPSYPAPAPSFHDDFGLNDNWLAAPFANGAGAPALSTPPRHHTVQNAAQARPAPTPPPHGGTLRCVCGPRSQWATEFVQCTHCSRYQHLECVTDGAGSAPALSPWVCAHCRLSFFLSQTGSAELLMMPRRVPDWSAMPSPHRVQNPEFTIPHAMYSAVVKDTAAGSVMLASVQINSPSIRPLFPGDVSLHLNHYDVQVPFLKKEKRSRLNLQQPPVDISNCVLPGLNVFTYAQGVQGYAFAVARVKPHTLQQRLELTTARSVDHMLSAFGLHQAVQSVKFAVQKPNKCSARQVLLSLRKQAQPGGASAGQTNGSVKPGAGGSAGDGGSGGGAGGAEEEDDDLIVATGVQIPLKDPVALTPIALPARGGRCNHVQCFDLRMFLTVNSKMSSNFRCPFCQEYLPVTDLLVDPYIQRVLNDVVHGDAKCGTVDGCTSGRGVAADDVTSIEFDGDASWKAVYPEPQRLASPAPARLRERPEASEGDTSRGRKRQRVAPPEPEIVSLLTDSDSDEGEDVRPQPGSMTATARISLAGVGADRSPASQPRNTGRYELPTGAPTTAAPYSLAPMLLAGRSQVGARVEGVSLAHGAGAGAGVGVVSGAGAGAGASAAAGGSGAGVGAGTRAGVGTGAGMSIAARPGARFATGAGTGGGVGAVGTQRAAHGGTVASGGMVASASAATDTGASMSGPNHVMYRQPTMPMALPMPPPPANISSHHAVSRPPAVPPVHSQPHATTHSTTHTQPSGSQAMPQGFDALPTLSSLEWDPAVDHELMGMIFGGSDGMYNNH